MDRKYRLAVRVVAATFILNPSAATSQDKKNLDDPLPAVFAKVLECRKLVDPDARLACFDTSVAALETANQQKSLVVISEETVKETRRGLFGLALPRIGIFRDTDDDEALKELSTAIKSVRGVDGAWVFTLEDGAVWQQTDGAYLRQPKVGQSITIRRAAMGSYIAKVEGGLGFRIKRVN